MFSKKIIEKHDKYAKHAIVYLDTIGVIKNLLLSALFLFSVHELIHMIAFIKCLTS